MRSRHLALAAIASVPCAMAVGGWLIARALTAPYTGRRYSVEVMGTTPLRGRNYALLSSRQNVSAPGPYGLLLQNGAHVPVEGGAELFGSLVGREIPESAVADLADSPLRASWTGIRFTSPAQAGLRHEDVHFDAPSGRIDAWLISGQLQDVWAIHVHGLGSSRAGTLRGAQVASNLGLTSLVTTYRNASEGPVSGAGRHTLGMAEAEDVSAAVQYAVEHGARRVILVGWSMGANIALTLAHQPGERHVIGIVADSPVLDWRATLGANLARASIPSAAARLAHLWLSGRVLSRLVGLEQPVDLDALDWTRPGRVRVPVLVLQGTADRSTPWEVPVRLARECSGVSLELFDADHTTSWNSDPERWTAQVSAWIAARLIDTSSV